MEPEDIGRPSNKLVLGKHSGRAALSSRLKELGFDLQSPSSIARSEVQGSRRSQEGSLRRGPRAIVTDEATQTPETYSLEYLHFISGTGVVPSATVKLRGTDRRSRTRASATAPWTPCSPPSTPSRA
jgi:2-isopropylmalate synthase